MYRVQDWAEVQRLHRQGWSNIAIAEKLGMSRNTVTRLLGLRQAPRYERCRAPSRRARSVRLSRRRYACWTRRRAARHRRWRVLRPVNHPMPSRPPI